jgi:hypothetical protein
LPFSCLATEQRNPNTDLPCADSQSNQLIISSVVEMILMPFPWSDHLGCRLLDGTIPETSCRKFSQRGHLYLSSTNQDFTYDEVLKCHFRVGNGNSVFCVQFNFLFHVLSRFALDCVANRNIRLFKGVFNWNTGQDITFAQPEPHVRSWTIMHTYSFSSAAHASLVIPG